MVTTWPTASPCPPRHRRRWDFTADGVERSLADSLRRLGLDRIDIAYLHDPDEHAEQALREAYPALEKLRDQGVIGAIGIGMNQAAIPARFVRETDIDVVLLAGRYTLLDQSGLDDLLPEPSARGVSRRDRAECSTRGCWPTRAAAPPSTTAPHRRMRWLVPCACRCCARSMGSTFARRALQFPFGHPPSAAS